MKAVQHFHLFVFGAAFVLGGVCYHVVIHFAGTAYPHAKLCAVTLGVLFLILGATAFYLGRGIQSTVVISGLVLAWLPVFLAGSIFGSYVFKAPAVGRGRQIRSVVDIHRVGQSLESFRHQNGQYPIAGSVEEVSSYMADELPLTDGWGYPLLIESGPEYWAIVGYGKYGRPDGAMNQNRGAVPGLEADIILTESGWQQFPEGIEIPSIEHATD